MKPSRTVSSAYFITAAFSVDDLSLSALNMENICDNTVPFSIPVCVVTIDETLLSPVAVYDLRLVRKLCTHLTLLTSRCWILSISKFTFIAFNAELKSKNSALT